MPSPDIDIPDREALVPEARRVEAHGAALERQAGAFIHEVASRMTEDYLGLILSIMCIDESIDEDREDFEENVRPAIAALRSPLESPPSLEWTPYDSLLHVLHASSTRSLFTRDTEPGSSVSQAQVLRSILASSIMLTEMKRGTDWHDNWGAVLAVFVRAATLADDSLATGAMQFLQWAMHGSQPEEYGEPGKPTGWITLCRAAHTLIASNLAWRGSNAISSAMESGLARYSLVERSAWVPEYGQPWPILLGRCGEEIGGLSDSLSALRNQILAEKNRRSESDEHDPRGG